MPNLLFLYCTHFNSLDEKAPAPDDDRLSNSLRDTQVNQSEETSQQTDSENSDIETPKTSLSPNYYNQERKITKVYKRNLMKLAVAELDLTYRRTYSKLSQAHNMS